jgi:hypothetical protein
MGIQVLTNGGGLAGHANTNQDLVAAACGQIANLGG